PFIASGSKTPPFPIAIYCHSDNHVSQMTELNALIEKIDLNKPTLTIATSVANVTGSMFPDHDRWYPVAKGRYTGIYVDWDDALPEVNGRSDWHFQRVATFCDTLVFMITKGKITEAANIPPQGSDVQTAELSDQPMLPALQVYRPNPPKRHSSSTTKPSLTPMPELSLTPSFKRLSVQSGSASRTSSLRSTVSSVSPSTISNSPPYTLHTARVTEQQPSARAGVPVFCFIRSLQGVVGQIVSAKDDLPESDYPPYGILGFPAEKYLKVHGYKASAVWSIIYAFKESYGPHHFITLLCLKGMPQLEVEYLFELITGRGLFLSEDDV
ncbi:hypothetical protein BU15DRAFT_43619, partial [Melanogaster broomeanus]